MQISPCLAGREIGISHLGPAVRLRGEGSADSARRVNGTASADSAEGRLAPSVDQPARRLS